MIRQIAWLMNDDISGISMNRRHNPCLILVALLLMTSTLPLTQAKEPDIDIDIDDVGDIFDDLDLAISNLTDRWSIPGTQVAVMFNGTLVFYNGYGVADSDSATNVTADSKFRIASLSKAVTSSGILTLIQNGTISLDDRMVDLIPGLIPSALEGCDYPSHSTSFSIDDITVSHLLNHRAGFDPSSDPTYWHWNTWDNRNDDCLDIDGLNTDYDDGNLAPVAMERILSEWLRRPLDYEPGSDYEYSNIGYQILGQIIEAQSGMGYEAYILENVLTPMGIDSMSIGMTMPDQRAENEVTYYDYEDDTSPCHFPSGEDADGDPVFPTAADPDCGNFVIEEKDGGGGWIATAADYARFLAHIDGTLTTTAFNDSFEYFISNPDAPEYSSYYGHGVFVSAANTNIWNHLGSFSGSSTYFKRVMVDNNGTDEPVFVVMFSNTRPTSSLDIDGSSWTSDRTSTIASEIYDVDWANISLSKPMPPCTPGDTKPADDGCNNCVCTEDEIWACTMIYCPDEGEGNETEVEEIPCNPGDTMPAEDGCNNCVCTANEEWACTLMYCPDDIDTIPRISMWAGKVNQHNENGTWMTDPDGVSGGHSSTDYPDDYYDRKLEYCQKFWPDTHDVYLLPNKETITFYTQGNQDAYESTKDVYQCVGANGIGQYGAGDIAIEPPVEEKGGVSDLVPGFSLAAALSMLGAAALLRRRRIEV